MFAKFHFANGNFSIAQCPFCSSILILTKNEVYNLRVNGDEVKLSQYAPYAGCGACSKPKEEIEKKLQQEE